MLNRLAFNLVRKSTHVQQKIPFPYTISQIQQRTKFDPSLNLPLETVDPELFDIIEHEKHRQYRGLQLIPSENFTSVAVLNALGSVMQNKYSEGYPGQRYYGGNEYIDMSERLCQKRALAAFGLNEQEWGVNVQCLSGSPANFYVYSALLYPHDRIMSLDLPHGGHLSHGYQTATKKISAVSKFFETLPYRLDEKTGLINYNQLDELAELYRPKLIVVGTSAYSRLIDYKRMREICDKHDAILLNDMSHISGLVAGGVIPSPFEYSDVVTTTAHKSLRGPRAAMIFYRKGTRTAQVPGKKEPKVYDYSEYGNKINAAVFPGHQGGPHNHTIAALSVALKQAASPEFKEYAQQVLINCKVLAERLKALGYTLVSGGTDNHLLLIDLKPINIDGARVERILELCSIAANKNTVPGDKSALVPGGLRIGSPAMTTRGLVESHFVQVADFIHEAVQIAQKVKDATAGKKLKEFSDEAEKNLDKYGITDLKNRVENFCAQFEAVGFDKRTMRYP
jgi:glycine hydroxymethyltransferase